jgi:phospholipid/cholesterol/gamma-HCH transport system permease protein
MPTGSDHEAPATEVVDDPEFDPASIPTPYSVLFQRPFVPIGDLFAFAIDVFLGIFKRPFQVREFFQQARFIISVTLLPTCLVSIPFGAVLALEIGGLFKQIGAQSFTGAAAVLGIIQQVAPIATVLMVAGAAGSAMCADLGSRKIRDELDAMEVLAVPPISRLVVPRVLACSFVAVLLNGVASVVGVSGGYLFNVVVQGGTPGAYLSSFTALAQLSDLWVGEFKALIFGLIAGVVASYKGMTADGGPKGVGDAVNQSVIISFVLLFMVNVVITALYFQIIPAKGT